jgi:ActR/RegA family two-component response regulator
VIIDDHPGFRDRLKSFVGAQHGCTVAGLAADTRTGLDLVHATRPDVVLIDIGLADESGLHLARRLAELDLGVRIVLMGEDETTEYERAAVQAGASAYISKTAISLGLPALLQPSPYPQPAVAAADVRPSAVPNPASAAGGTGGQALPIAPSMPHFAGLEAAFSATVLMGGILFDRPATAFAGVVGFAFLSYRQMTLPRLTRGHPGKRVLHRVQGAR